jgi:hypothetical protein
MTIADDRLAAASHRRRERLAARWYRGGRRSGAQPRGWTGHRPGQLQSRSAQPSRGFSSADGNQLTAHRRQVDPELGGRARPLRKGAYYSFAGHPRPLLIGVHSPTHTEMVSCRWVCIPEARSINCIKALRKPRTSRWGFMSGQVRGDGRLKRLACDSGVAGMSGERSEVSTCRLVDIKQQDSPFHDLTATEWFISKLSHGPRCCPAWVAW